MSDRIPTLPKGDRISTLSTGAIAPITYADGFCLYNRKFDSPHANL
ncbi:hypothetical protein [Chroococcidiopsis sp.]